MEPVPLIIDVDAVPEAVRENHRALSEADWQLRRRAFEDRDLLRRDAFPAIQRAHPFTGLVIQEWPALVAHDVMAELGRLTVELVELVKSLPQRWFGSDPQKLADFYGQFPAPMMEILLAEPNGIAPSLARGDFLLDEDGWKCLELNVSSNLGGWEMDMLRERYLESSVLTRAFDEIGVEPVGIDPAALLFEHVLEEVGRHVRDAGDEIRVALVSGAQAPFPDNPEVRERLGRSFAKATAARGVRGEVELARIDHLQVRGGTVHHAGKRLHALLLNLVPARPDLYRCFKAGRLAIFNGPLEPMLSTKRNLALLSEHAGSERWTDRERELIAKHLPWTREVRAGETTYDGAAVDLPAFLLDERQRLVLKPALESGGRGVLVGAAAEPREWRAQVDAALSEGGWIVQERVESRPFLYRYGDEGAALHRVVWGPFALGQRYGGVVLRLQPLAHGDVVSVAGGATGSTVLEV